MSKSRKTPAVVDQVNREQIIEEGGAPAPVPETNGVPVAQVAPPSNGKPKTTCPVSRATYLDKAPAIEVMIDGNKFVAGPREFSTGSLGYNVSGKYTATVDGKVVTYQVGLNVTAVGSKELPK